MQAGIIWFMNKITCILPSAPRSPLRAYHTIRKFTVRKIIFLPLLALVLTLVLTGQPSNARAAGGPPADAIQGFQSVSPHAGWLQFDQHLYWTDDDGGGWHDITPPLELGESIAAVRFLDAGQGWVLLDNGAGGYILASTTDGGSSWQRAALDLPGLDQSVIPPASVFMDWRDDAHGWLVMRLTTGSSFSLGLLYVTADGGATWQQREVPLGEPVFFASDAVGWIAGGPAGNALYRTLNGGQTWDLLQPAGADARYLLPHFDNESNGLLPVLAADGASGTADFYGTSDGGQSWTLLGSFALPADTPLDTDLPVAMQGSGSLLLTVPNSNGIVRAEGGHFEQIANQDGQSAALTRLSMPTLESGWGLAQSGSCATQPDGSLACSRESKLLATSDGGVNWTPVSLPLTGDTSIAESFALADKTGSQEGVSALDADTQPYTGQGFDKCGLPGLSNMQTWWNGSPYNGFNLYIGGSAYACRNTLPTASYVSTLSAQGWRFFPTWVGPQAPCMNYASVFSYNTSTAYSQGVAEADAALATAANLGLAAPDQSGTVIYYDMETYGTTDTCRKAVNSFLSGWTYELRAHNNLAGVYGNACYNATDWATIANVPDAVWLAHWYLNPAYMPTASTSDSCVSSSLWSNHQRLRQYAGDHTEIWGGVSLGGIDSNALDGPLTVQNGTAGTSLPSAPIAALPLPSSTVARNADTWLTWKTTGNTCSLYVWGNGLNLSSTGICSIYHLGPKLPGTYFWQVIASNNLGTTTGATWQFGVAPALPGTLSVSPVGSTHANLTWALSSDDPTYVDGYRIYADGLLAGIVARGTRSFQVDNLSCNSVHSFYVTATWQGIASGAGNVASFTTPTCAPTLLSPADGSTPLSLRPTFSWQAVAQATGYALQASLFPDFSTLAINASLSGTSYTVPADLLPTTLYYWKVRSTGGFGTSDWSPVRSFTSPEPPPIPGLTSPGVNALTTDYTPFLDWSEPNLTDGTLVDHYQVQLDTSSAFVAPLYDQQTVESDFTVPANLQPNSVYYWRVRAFNTLGQYTAWAGTWYFRTAITPPVLLDPPVGTVLTTLRLTLDWADVPGASSYVVNISRYPDFSSIMKSVTSTPSTYAMTSDLPLNTLLYWRVKAKGANGPSLWSTVWSFTTGGPPSVPSLQYPANGTLLTAYQPTLNWSDSTLPLGTLLDHYQAQLATDSAFASVLYDRNTVDSQFPLPAPLAPNARYYWRVRAFNTFGEYSSWSSVRYFKAAILPATLTSPPDGTSLPTRRPTFDWQDVSGASGYLIRISRYSNFSSVLISVTVTPSIYTPTSDLPANTLLYWKVQARGTNGPSLWSTVRSFTTSNPPSVPSLQYPANKILLTTYQPSLNWSDSVLPLGTLISHYEVQLATDSAFATLLYDQNTADSQFQPPVPLAPNTRYYWRVRAFNTNGHYSSWSSVRYFRTAILPPALSSPGVSEIVGTLRPTFDWGDVVGATSYTIQVSRYSTFSTTLLSVKVTGSVYKSGINLPKGVPLYWRVRANGANGPSLWAEVPPRSFTIVLP